MSSPSQTTASTATAACPMRVVIADDEPLARERLRTLLAKEPDVEIAAECADGDEAVAAIRGQNPDLVFLDIQMPGRDGFGVLAALAESAPGAPRPAIVFTTAYNEYAVKAFEVRALDYLLKPFKPARFRETLARARRQVFAAPPPSSAADAETPFDQLVALLNEHRALTAATPAQNTTAPAAGPRTPSRIPVRDGGRIHFVNTTEIAWIEASGNYVLLHTAGGAKHMLRETLLSLENQLGAHRFFRVSRSAIVNLDQVREAQPAFDGDHVVILRTGARIPMTRGLRDLQERLRFL